MIACAQNPYEVPVLGYHTQFLSVKGVLRMRNNRDVTLLTEANEIELRCVLNCGLGQVTRTMYGQTSTLVEAHVFAQEGGDRHSQSNWYLTVPSHSGRCYTI
ncbi:hypothetical protein R1flu_000598 [Riccia fluitans]|uniref:Uncharacterized protein n=1 Tax=Riccia fluitans TaxID=41844 RepID=A0ABD1Y0X2_9MARC